MSRRVAALLLLLPLALAVPAASAAAEAPSAAEGLPEYVFATAPEDEVQDVLFLGGPWPVFLRFRIRVAGDGFRIAWSGFIVRLHRYLDADGDGVLTAKEAQRGNWQQLLQNPFGPRRPDNQPGAGAAVLDPDKDGKVSVDELAKYLGTTLGADAFGLQGGAAPDPRSRALFGLLDLDRDGKLATSELADADACLARHDLDEDELIGLAELKPYENPYATLFRGGMNAQTPMNPAADDSPVVVLGPGTVHDGLARRLLGRYDRAPRDGRLGAAELGGGPEVVRRFDANADGGLDAGELTKLLRLPPADLEMSVALGAVGKGDSTVGLSATPRPPLRVSGAAGTKRLELEGVEVDLAVEDNVAGGNRESILQRFKIFDGDNDGYLDKKEVERRPVFLQMMPVADRDGDERLSRKEVEAYLDRQADATASRTMLTIVDDGRALFEVLDADGDRRLGLRELRGARGLLDRVDRDGDGRVALDEIPHRYRLAVGRGRVPPNANRGYDPGSPDEPGRPRRVGAPTWFEKMDRNRDGDLSPREFLGSREDFRRFDADADGLIDAGEAARAP